MYFSKTSKYWIPAIAVSILFLSTIGYTFWRTWDQNPQPFVIETTVSPSSIHIGTPIHVEAILRLPWYRYPVKTISSVLPEGLQALDHQVRWKSLGWGTWDWHCFVAFQAYNLGGFKEIKAIIPLTADKDSQEKKYELTIPNITVIPRDKTIENLYIAPEFSEDTMESTGKVIFFWVSMVLLGITLVFIIAFLINKNRSYSTIPLPKPWEIAEEALHNLEDTFPIDAETFFVKSTDIMRRYLEASYRVPATERTTPEFLQEIQKQPCHLSTEQCFLLKEFLVAADMVKFARLDVTQEQIKETSAKAKHFVVDTSAIMIAKQKQEGKEVASR